MDSPLNPAEEPAWRVPRETKVFPLYELFETVKTPVPTLVKLNVPTLSCREPVKTVLVLSEPVVIDPAFARLFATMPLPEREATLVWNPLTSRMELTVNAEL